MRLSWQEEYVDQRIAETDMGTYRITDADSLGRNEVTFTNETGEHFVGTVFGIEDGIKRAESHADWLSKVAKNIGEQEKLI